MGKIIAIANQKGGVAKTTSTHNLGVGLANKGKTVLLVDLDSQASLTISCGIEPLEIEDTIVDVLSKKAKPVEQCIQTVESESLHIITSIIDLAQLEMDMLSRASRERILDRALATIKEAYDYILIDCPPQLGILTINALSCADGVIIPVKTDYLAYRGLTQLYDTIEEIKELINPSLRIIGVIPTMFERRISDDVAIVELLNSSYHVLGVVKKMAAAKKGVLDGLSVVSQSPNSDVAQAYIAIVERVVEMEEQDDEKK